MGDTPLTADDLDLFRKAASALDTAWSEPVLALLDMVDGYQQLVRMLHGDDIQIWSTLDQETRKWTNHAALRGDVSPLADARPDLAALLDLALTPQGDEEA